MAAVGLDQIEAANLIVGRATILPLQPSCASHCNPVTTCFPDKKKGSRKSAKLAKNWNCASSRALAPLREIILIGLRTEAPPRATVRRTAHRWC